MRGLRREPLQVPLQGVRLSMTHGRGFSSNVSIIGSLLVCLRPYCGKAYSCVQ